MSAMEKHHCDVNDKSGRVESAVHVQLHNSAMVNINPLQSEGSCGNFCFFHSW